MQFRREYNGAPRGCWKKQWARTGTCCGIFQLVCDLFGIFTTIFCILEGFWFSLKKLLGSDWIAQDNLYNSICLFNQYWKYVYIGMLEAGDTYLHFYSVTYIFTCVLTCCLFSLALTGLWRDLFVPPDS